MQISDQLEIIIITYNRVKYLKETLNSLFDKNSPFNKCKITIINNNSTDNTALICEDFNNKYENCKYINNKYNIGWSDISQAFFIAEKKYLWVLADDDYFDFSSFNEIEDAIREEADIICCCKHILKSPDVELDKRYQLIQFTLLPSCIYNVSKFKDVVLKNMFENNYTMFPHMVPIITAFNNNWKIKILKHELLKIGIHVTETDCSYSRGYTESEIWPRNRAMSWIVGFANVCSGLNDKKLTQEAVALAIQQPWTYGGWDYFYSTVIKLYSEKKHYHTSSIYISHYHLTKLENYYLNF